jgi:hypothetical protein
VHGAGEHQKLGDAAIFSVLPWLAFGRFMSAFGAIADIDQPLRFAMFDVSANGHGRPRIVGLARNPSI